MTGHHVKYDLLLLNPALQLTRVRTPDFVFPWVNGGHGWMPLAPLFLASYLKQAGFSVFVLDMELYSSVDEQQVLERYVRDSSFVGISAMTMHVPHALVLTEYVKKIKPDIQVVWGGVHASLLPTQTVAHPLIDAVIVGEGEEALACLLRGEDHPRIETKQKQLGADAQVCFMDVDNIADPDYSVLEMSRYLAFQGKYRNVDILTSRGCPRRCSFCINTILGSKWRSFDAERSIAYIHRVVDSYHPRHTFLMDENFFADVPRAQQIVNCFKARGITWEANVTIKAVAGLHQTGTLAQLKACGCTRLRMGAESASDRLLKILRKGIVRADIEQAVAACLSVDITPILSFMVDLPDELLQEKVATMSFAKKCGMQGAAIIGPQRFRPYPGSEEFNKLVSKGLRIPQSLTAWGACDLFNTVK